MSSETQVRIELFSLTFFPQKNELKIAYGVSLSTQAFEGVVGAGETHFTNEAEVTALSDLAEKIRRQIESDLGLSANSETAEDEDAL
jgi:hypothetical protein